MKKVDLFIIGGGINGVGIARDAAGRGLSVVLCEKDDLAEGTSSRSGKLVHGGLRYLEYYEFRLVREALIEREVLLNSASHIIWPMRFVIPHSTVDRPAWLIRLGLFLYDHLGGRKKLPGTRSLNLHTETEGAPLQDQFTKGFEYSDCWVDDARLVVLNALDAHERGAEIRTRTICTSANRQNGRWVVEMTDVNTGVKQSVEARAVINAGGPWVNDIIGRVVRSNSKRTVRLVKGSHIVVEKFWDGQQAYVIQNDDKRLIFVNPYEGDKALIGTTDIPYDDAPENVTVDDAEVQYLIDVANRYFKRQLQPVDVLQKFSGVRPLYDDGKGNPSAVTRDYVLDLDDIGGAPLLNIFGGKITTFRKLAEQALEKLSPYFPDTTKHWTAGASLPGGDIPNADFERFLNRVFADFAWLPKPLGKHFCRLYGTRLYDLLGEAKSIEDLGRQFGPLLYEAEARYLINVEWARSVDDIICRRTKHYITMSDEERCALENWLDDIVHSAA